MKVPGKAKYRGDVSKSVVGNVMGPTTYGSLVKACEAEYNPETNLTTVLFENVGE